MDSPHPRYHKNRESCTDLLHQHIAFTYFLLSSQVYYYYYPTSAKDMKEFLPNFRPWQDSDQERATRLTPTRALLIFCDPTIVKDPKRTPATASLFDLQGLQKNFLSNHALWSPACMDSYAISRPPVSPCNTFTYSPTSPLNQLSQPPSYNLVLFHSESALKILLCGALSQTCLSFLCYNFQHIHNSQYQVSDSGKDIRAMVWNWFQIHNSQKQNFWEAVCRVACYFFQSRAEMLI
jgi:hypothetical protein